MKNNIIRNHKIVVISIIIAQSSQIPKAAVPKGAILTAAAAATQKPATLFYFPSKKSGMILSCGRQMLSTEVAAEVVEKLVR